MRGATLTCALVGWGDNWGHLGVDGGSVLLRAGGVHRPGDNFDVLADWLVIVLLREKGRKVSKEQ